MLSKVKLAVMVEQKPLVPINVIGAGSFGTALAIHLARNSHCVRIWGHDEDELKAMQSARENERYLPGIALPENLEVFTSLKDSFKDLSEAIIIAVPSSAVEEVLSKLKPYIKDAPLVLAAKGLSEEGELLCHALEKIAPSQPYAVISGPSFAKEVALGLPTAVTLASSNNDLSDKLAKIFHSQTFRVYTSDDVIGVEVGGVLKNVLAIAVGMSDGMGFGANARCALITRGLAELQRLGQALGAKPETITGLSGLGDMVLTCTDNQSRNRRYGLAIGAGKSNEQALEEIGQVVEGRRNARQVQTLSRKFNVELPICHQVYQILYQGLPADEGVKALLSRSQKSETN